MREREDGEDGKKRSYVHITLHKLQKEKERGREFRKYEKILKMEMIVWALSRLMWPNILFPLGGKTRYPSVVHPLDVHRISTE